LYICFFLLLVENFCSASRVNLPWTKCVQIEQTTGSMITFPRGTSCQMNSSME
jgi:hypothetical protein